MCLFQLGFMGFSFGIIYSFTICKDVLVYTPWTLNTRILL